MNWLLLVIAFGGLALVAVSFVLSSRSKRAANGSGAPAVDASKAPSGAMPVGPSAVPTTNFAIETGSVPAIPSLDTDSDGIDCDVTDVFQVPSQDTSSGVLSKNEYLPKFYDDRAGEDTITRSRELMLLVGSARTDKGLVRSGNEDAVLTMHEQGVFAVADGMGGHQQGEVASNLAVSAIEDAINSPIETAAITSSEDLPTPSRVVAGAMRLANERVYAEARSQMRKQRMGTTLVVAHFATRKRRLAIGHVGDSRIYRLRAGELVRLSTDHTLGELGIPGPMAGRLSRAVGIGPAVRIDLMLGVPQEGDIYLLCTDGLTRSVNDTTLQEILHANVASPPQQVVDELVNLANARGGRDNISAVVIRVEEGRQAS